MLMTYLLQKLASLNVSYPQVKAFAKQNHISEMQAARVLLADALR